MLANRDKPTRMGDTVMNKKKHPALQSMDTPTCEERLHNTPGMVRICEEPPLPPAGCRELGMRTDREMNETPGH